MHKNNRYYYNSSLNFPGPLRPWKMPGAGGCGYLVLVVKDAKTFAQEREEAIEIHIRRQ